MKRVLISTLLAGLLITSGYAKDENKSKDLTVEQVNQQSLKKAKNGANSKKAQLVQEAIASLHLAAKALNDLNSNNTKSAKENIEKALGKLEAILSVEHTPKLLPIENRIVAKNYLGTAKDVEKSILMVKDLLNAGKVQDARVLLNTLQSEIDITVINLPLVSYPDALKLASKYIIDNKPEKAKEVLKVALSTFTEVEHIIPIPMINSIELVKLASNIAKENKDLALKYLKGASDELDKAEKLGYISKSATTYKELHELIEKTEKEVKGPNKAEKLFKELGDKLKEFKDKIFSSKSSEINNKK